MTIDGNVYRHDNHPDTVTIGSIIEYRTTVCYYGYTPCPGKVTLKAQFKVNEPSLVGDETFLSFIWLEFDQNVQAEMSHHIELVDVCVKTSEILENSAVLIFEYWQSRPGLVWESNPTAVFNAVRRLC